MLFKTLIYVYVKFLMLVIMYLSISGIAFNFRSALDPLVSYDQQRLAAAVLSAVFAYITTPPMDFSKKPTDENKVYYRKR